MTDGKTKAVEVALANLNKEYGTNAVYFLGDRKKDNSIEAISSGSYNIDRISGIGGFPRGRIIEIFGNEGGGKTTILLLLIASAQRKGHTCAFIDVEHSLNLKRAKELGVDVDKLIFSQPDHGEQAFDIVDNLARSGGVSIIGVDSTAALITKAELEGTFEDKYIAVQARLISQSLKKIVSSVSRSGTICVFINQLRDKPGVLFGPSETTPGGRALKFYSSIRLSVNKGEAIKSETNGIKSVYGHVMKIKAVKNKVAPPYEEGRVTLYYKQYGNKPVGIDIVDDIFEAAIARGILVKKGKQYAFGEKVCVEEDKMKEYIEKSEKFRNVLIERLSKNGN